MKSVAKNQVIPGKDRKKIGQVGLLVLGLTAL